MLGLIFRCLQESLFLDLKGNFISRNFPDFNNLESNEITIWQKFVKNSLPECVHECLTGSIFMHNKLNNIDKIAWDWIPRTPNPILLEGNSGFGMFIPDMFDMIYS